MEDNQVIVDVQMDALIESLRRLNKEYEIQAAVLKDMKEKGEETTEEYIKLSQEMKVTKQEISGVEKQIQNEIKARKAQDDSLVQLRARLANLNKQYDSMSGIERMSDAGEALQKQIKALHDQILGLEGATGRMQRNVGNYPEAVQPLIEQMNQLIKQMDELEKAGKADSAEFAEMEKQLQSLEQSVNGLTGEVRPLKQQLKEATNELIQMKMEGKENTEQYRQLLERVGQMKDIMADAQAQIKQMASDTSALNSVLDGAKAAAGGFSVALGVMNLVGDQDSETAKEMAEAQKKLQAAIAITTGLQSVQNALQKESALMMGIAKLQMLAAAKAQDMYTASLGRATAAQRLFNTVAKSNPYVLLAGLILSVVGAIGVFNIGSREQEEQLKNTNDELNNHAKLLKDLTDSYDTLNKQAEHYIENQLEWAKEEGKSTEEIRRLEEQLFQNRLAQFKAEEKRLEEIGYSYNDLTILYRRNLAEQTKLAAQRTEALLRGDEKEADSIHEKIKASKEFTDYLKEQLDYINDFNIRYDEFLLQDRQRLNRYKQEDAEKEKQAEEERKRQAEAARQRHEKRLEQLRKEREAYKKTSDELINALSSLGTADEEREKADQKAREAAERLYNSVHSTIESMMDMVEVIPKPLETVSEAVSDLSNNAPSAMEQFAAAFSNSAQEIMTTSSALENSFSSISTIYQQMAKDETKSEEEREKAAKKAKAWARLQIAANSGTAMAKGIADAMDAPWPANLGALATTLAALLSAIAQAKSMLAYEGGGVIGGYRGATRGQDNTYISARQGEMVLNADQQRQLFNIANGGSQNGGLAAALASALESMPAPILDYSEFVRFKGRVVTLDDISLLK